MKQKPTYQLPSKMHVGDIVAVSGKGFLSTLIKLFSFGISHVEIIAVNAATGKRECFSADQYGARFKPLENVVRDTKGSIYYLPLRDDVRAKLDIDKINETMAELAQKEVPYDFLHFVGVAIDDHHIDALGVFSKIPKWIFGSLKGAFQNTETMTKVVCSGACAWGFKMGLGIDVNASEESPLDICRYNLYKAEPLVLKGKAKNISKYNTNNVL